MTSDVILCADWLKMLRLGGGNGGGGAARLDEDAGQVAPTFRSNLLHPSSMLKSSWKNDENIDGYAFLLMLTAE